MDKILEWAKRILYKIFPAQKRGRERALQEERQTMEADRNMNHYLFRRIKDMDSEAIERLRKTQMGPIIEKMARQEEARRNANH